MSLGDPPTKDSEPGVSSSFGMDMLQAGVILLVPVLAITSLFMRNYTLAVGLVVGYLPTVVVLWQLLMPKGK